MALLGSPRARAWQEQQFGSQAVVVGSRAAPRDSFGDPGPGAACGPVRGAVPRTA
jgi:hypothetical protein